MEHAFLVSFYVSGDVGTSDVYFSTISDSVNDPEDSETIAVLLLHSREYVDSSDGPLPHSKDFCEFSWTTLIGFLTDWSGTNSITNFSNADGSKVTVLFSEIIIFGV